jgi:hypothetical protein
MKTKLLTAICALTLLSTATPAFADEDKSLEVVADVGLVRPSCLVVTVAGTALFVAILPIAAVSRSVKRTAHTLVTVPAKATFTRPVGDFDSLKD